MYDFTAFMGATTPAHGSLGPTEAHINGTRVFTLMLNFKELSSMLHSSWRELPGFSKISTSGTMQKLHYKAQKNVNNFFFFFSVILGGNKCCAFLM